MFTGIITDQGRVSAREDRGDTRFVIETRYQVEDIALGASIACSGCCLTVIETGRTPQGQGWFAVEASGETLSKTTLDGWSVGSHLNLERALRLGDELGGHFVLGHVDGVAGRRNHLHAEALQHAFFQHARSEPFVDDLTNDSIPYPLIEKTP